MGPGGTPVTIRAQLADASGNPVATPGKVVTGSSSGGGTFASPTATTDAAGLATVVFTCGAVVGTVHAVTATDAEGLTGTSPAISVVTPAVGVT